MTTDRPTWLSPAETASRLGLTVRTLRVYEQKGLLTPDRTQAGWRAYGPPALARLHQILALKGLGLSLAQIKSLLLGKMGQLDALLALQEDVLRLQKDRAEAGLKRLSEARKTLATGASLSLEDLITLSKETQMSDKSIGSPATEAILSPLFQKHFSKDDLQTLAARRPTGEAEVAIKTAWDDTIAEAKRLYEIGDPKSVDAFALHSRWLDLVNQFSGGNDALRQKGAAMWTEALSNPANAQNLPFDLGLWNFVKSIGAAKRGEI